jgi:hypothetical protein
MALILGQDRPQMPLAEDEHLRGGIFTAWIPASARTASNDALN